MITKSLKKICNTLGFNITRFNKVVDSKKYNWLKELDIRTVIDVGANVGQSALIFYGIFPQSFIYSFEPIKNCYEKLEENLKSFQNHKSFNLALGSKKEKSVIYLNEFNPSSSLLRMNELHKNVFPFTINTIEESIDVDTLDNIFHNIDLAKNILLKIDVQGFEKEVLLGGQEILKTICLIIIEISFLELYKGSANFTIVYNLLSKAGFEYIGSMNQYNNPLDGRPLQQDAIFYKK